MVGTAVPGAFAQEFNAGVLGISEIRAGLADHDVYNGWLPITPQNYRINGIEDFAFEVLFNSPDLDAFRWIGSPRPSIGASINLSGAESIAHAGLSWQLPVFDTPVYLEATFGAMVHDGVLFNATAPQRSMGCRITAYSSLGIGANLGDHFTVTAFYEHGSGWKFCLPNDGLSNFGIKLGYKF